MNTVVLSPEQLEIAIDLLKNGDPVAIPTETVYGLAAPIFSVSAMQKIFALKKRPSDNPLIAHVGTFGEVESVARDLPETFYKLAQAFWPGPLTFVLPKNESVPLLATAGRETIAVRMPSHPLALRVIEGVGQPLVAPSANLSGKPSPTCIEHVLEDLSGSLLAVLDGGPCCVGIESTVLSLIDNRPILLRPGAISKGQIEQVLNETIQVATDREQGMSPGMKYRHYAPKAVIHVVNTLPPSCDSGSFVLSREPTGVSLFRPLQAKTLYAFFREADRLLAKEIFVLLDPLTSSDEALMNRLQKAADRSTQ